MPSFLEITTLEYINFALITAAVIIGYKYIESFWSYKISKPYIWENRSTKSPNAKILSKIENRYNDKVRFYNFWIQIERIKRSKIKGDFAELGVHKGQSAKAIYTMAPERKLHLFDTFTGFNKEDLKKEPKQNNIFNPKMFNNTSLKEVSLLLGESDNILFYPGIFQETKKELENSTFAFVHLDADLYAPTFSALEFFYPRLSAGGVLIVHDYNHNWEGIKKALNEFELLIPESLIELPDRHGSVMIIKNNS